MKMLNRMILINSANFQFADINLSKEVFFVGDNASGKTTTTRAIHFLYNGNGEKLGIPRTKDTFSKHYFSNDDSYIIYVFETFFIFTFKKNNAIQRWFSKQEFNLNEVIKNDKLLDFETIEEYIKNAPLRKKPTSIIEYTDILYGKDKRFLDFSIAKIDNYKVFLEVFNMIFNVDKAIVTAIDIKKAIQKSLERKDEVLEINYDDFSRKLNDFLKSYSFFKAFDSNRNNLSDALSLMEKLINLELKITKFIKAINYKSKVELNEFSKLEIKKNDLKLESSRFSTKIKIFNGYHENFKKRIEKKDKELLREILKIEELKERFDSIEVEKNIELASNFKIIKTELENKRFELKSLQDKVSSAKKVIENQIEQLEYKKNTAIPNELNIKFLNMSQVEMDKFEEDKLLIERKYNEQENNINIEIGNLEENISIINDELLKIDEFISKNVTTLRKKSDLEIKILREKINADEDKTRNLRKVINNLKEKKDKTDDEQRKHEDKYEQLRRTNAKSLWKERGFQNKKIKNAKAILFPIPNSFNEFLSENIDNWEKEIYPIIDKNLLIKSCDELKPIKLNADSPLSFRIDTSNLESIPTKDEATEIIKKAREIKIQALRNSKSVYKDEIVKLDSIKNQLVANYESIEEEIKNSNKELSNLTLVINESNNSIDEIEQTLIKDVQRVKDKHNAQKEELNSNKKAKNSIIKNKKNIDLVSLKEKKIKEIRARKKDKDNNILILENQMKNEKLEVIKTVNREIVKLKESVEKTSEDSLIESLINSISELDEKYNSSLKAKTYLEEYELKKDEIKKLPLKQMKKDKLERQNNLREKFIKETTTNLHKKIEQLLNEIKVIIEKIEIFEKGIKKFNKLDIKTIDGEIETKEYLTDLISDYEEQLRIYSNDKSKFRTLIDKLKKIEKHSIIEINLNNDMFDEAESINDLRNIIESLNELNNFEKNKYDSEKKRKHKDFDSFLKNTIPSKIQSFGDLEMDFENAKNIINRSLTNADFGVIRDIKLSTNTSEKRNDSIASLMQSLSHKVKSTVNLYSKDSLFYFDVPKSVDNIDEIQKILEEIKKKGSNGMINLFDTIDLSISYIENGKKVENKQNIKDDSSSGGNILLKVAIAISILNRYAKKTTNNTPFFLIIDEVSKLQSKNQNLIKKYINDNGFKTLFITPDPAFPDPEKALYYTFKNIQDENENLEIRQMNII
ncbi:MAG: hypothetical protein RBR93_07605 [Aliarcobacter butzleri]|nr:hypothetical protein [Aliarcobacter butzleri]